MQNKHDTIKDSRKQLPRQHLDRGAEPTERANRSHLASAYLNTIAWLIACLLVVAGAGCAGHKATVAPAPTTNHTAGRVELLKPVVYIASPYSKGDPSINAHFQCEVFDQLMNDGVVWPVAPLWAHFQHVIFPRPYKDWVDYDMAMIQKYDACLRLNSKYDKLGYTETQSSGADNEVAEFQRLGKPVFYSVEDLYAWAKHRVK